MARTTTETRSLASGPTIASTRDYWTLHLRSMGRAPRTIATYLRALDRLDRFLADKGMPQGTGCNPPRAPGSCFLVDLQERGNQPATVSILFRALRVFWSWLVDEIGWPVFPMEKMHTPSAPVNPPPVLSQERSPACWRLPGTDLIARRDQAMLALMLDTGTRRGEVAGLRVGISTSASRWPSSRPRLPRAAEAGGRLRREHGESADALLRHPRAPHGDREPLWRARTGPAADRQ